jgi:hypothetical protein
MLEHASPRPTRPPGVALAGLTVLVLMELGLIGWALVTGAALVFAVGQALILALLALGIVMGRFVRFRGAYERALAQSGAEHERSRLAEELHDVLGHELSLVALRAGALQVTTVGDAADRASALRLQVEQVVLELRQTVEMLRDGRGAAPMLEPAELNALVLVERSREAGALVTLDGVIGDAVPAPVRLTVYSVVREGLTNALKHSPGSAVQVRQWYDAQSAHVEVEVDGGAGESPATWSGLATLHDRVEALGGDLTITGSNGRRLLSAQIPMHMSPRPSRRESVTTRTGKRPARATIRWALPPLAVIIVATTAFYTWSTHDATLEQSIFDDIHKGQRLDDVIDLLPRREAVIRLTPLPPTPSRWHCAYYTDGNFPLGMAAFEICDDGTRITRTTDLRRVPLP